ncbi:MAG: aminotransferase class IV [Caulobacter sp.]|nr:aminotransferase class IV [Caulobacter sp.]
MMPLDDRGLLLGDGLFETLLVKKGEIILLEAHVARLQSGCMALGLPAPDLEDVRQLCSSILSDADRTIDRLALRLTLTAGSGGRGLDRPADPEPHIFASVAPAPRPEGPADLSTSDIRRNEGTPTSRLKTLSYIDNVLARQRAAPAEALMLNNAGEIVCAAAANIFWVQDGRLFTPELGCGALDGVMRRQVMAIEPADEVRAPRAMLERVQAIFLTNSLIGVRRVASLDGAPMGDHRLLARLTERLAAVS